MIELDALIDLFFTDQPWERRVGLIAGCGYTRIETWQGGDAAVLRQIAGAGRDCGVGLVSIVVNFATDAQAAPIGPDNRQRFIEQVDRCSDNALAAGCTQGIVTAGQSIGGMDYQVQRSALVDALRAAGELAARKGFRIVLEPLNTAVDHPGYFLASPLEGVAIVKATGCDNVSLLYDLYHMGIMGGNQTAFLEANIRWIGHFHAAGIPGRHEPFEGETNYPFILERIARAGYHGCFGLEYLPRLESRESLTQTRDYLTLSD